MIYSLQSLSSFNGVIIGSAMTGEAVLVSEVPASSFSDFSDVSSDHSESTDRRSRPIHAYQIDGFTDRLALLTDSNLINNYSPDLDIQPARRSTDIDGRRQALLTSSQSRILIESKNWTEWFLPSEWLTLSAYAIVIIWVGYAETVLSPLTPLLETQTHSSPSTIAFLTLGSSLGFVTASLFSGFAQSPESGCISAPKRHRLLCGAVWLGSVTMLFVCQSQNVIVECGLWCLINMGCGVLEPSINAFVFELTANDDEMDREQRGSNEFTFGRNATDPVFAAMVAQVIYGLFSIGTIIAPLSIQWSVSLTSSYSVALFFAALFGLISGLVLLCVSPPSSKKMKSEKKKKMNTPINCSNGQSYGSNNSDCRLPLELEDTEDLPPTTTSSLDCSVPTAIGALLILMSSFFGALMVAANVFVGDYTHKYLQFSSSFGRTLNTSYFTAQMIGRLVWIIPVRYWPVAFNLGAVCVLTCLSLLVFALSPLWFGQSNTSWQFQLALIIGFSLPGFCKAPIIALTLQFIDTIAASSTVWSSLTMAGWAVGTCSGTLIAGYFISNFGFVTFPYVLFVYSGIPLIIYAVIIAASIIYFSSDD